MSKRPCPFEDNCAPQLKIHVSTEDINRQNENYLKEIQARTLAKLYQGTNGNNKQDIKHTEKVHFETRICPECRKYAELISKCWFCELLLCQGCVRICTRCSERFCSRCSVAIYKYGSSYTCLTCYN